MNLLLLNKDYFDTQSENLVRITGNQYKHMLSVLRVKLGDQIKVGLENSYIGEGIVTTISPDFVELKVIMNAPPPPPLPCTLIVALPRPKSLRKVIECSISLGIKKIFIIGSYRVEKSFWSTPFLSKDKLDTFITNGLEQARDTVFPAIEIRKLFKPFVEDEIPHIIKETRAFIAHPYNANPCPAATASPFTLAIGPEGGFIPYEVELLKKHGFECVSYGQRILRVEYAVPALVCRLY